MKGRQAMCRAPSQIRRVARVGTRGAVPISLRAANEIAPVPQGSTKNGPSLIMAAPMHPEESRGTSCLPSGAQSRHCRLQVFEVACPIVSHSKRPGVEMLGSCPFAQRSHLAKMSHWNADLTCLSLPAVWHGVDGTWTWCCHGFRAGAVGGRVSPVCQTSSLDLPDNQE
jgi:hypothetical protein